MLNTLLNQNQLIYKNSLSNKNKAFQYLSKWNMHAEQLSNISINNIYKIF